MVNDSLQELHACCASEVPRQCQGVDRCISYVSCGPYPACTAKSGRNPCEKCLCWTDYGAGTEGWERFVTELMTGNHGKQN